MLRLDHYVMVLCFSRHAMMILSYNVNEYTYPMEVCECLPDENESTS
jgi:hypothetical protein